VLVVGIRGRRELAADDCDATLPADADSPAVRGQQHAGLASRLEQRVPAEDVHAPADGLELDPAGL
jgi:hypothetical protein